MVVVVLVPLGWQALGGCSSIVASVGWQALDGCSSIGASLGWQALDGYSTQYWCLCGVAGI